MTIHFPIFSFELLQSNTTTKFLSLVEGSTELNSTIIDDAFRELKPVKPDQLIGEWDGYILSTDHPFEKVLEELNWFGNTFDSIEDVVPIIVARNGNRVYFEDWGHASLREVKYKGVVSAALVYDERPIMVHYRLVRSNMVAGLMESKSFGPSGNFYFYLTK